MSLKKQALTGTLWAFLQQFSTQEVGFVISIVLVRLLLPEEFGLIAMIMVFIGIGNILMNAGLGSFIIKIKKSIRIKYFIVFWYWSKWTSSIPYDKKVYVNIKYHLLYE